MEERRHNTDEGYVGNVVYTEMRRVKGDDMRGGSQIATIGRNECMSTIETKV